MHSIKKTDCSDHCQYDFFFKKGHYEVANLAPKPAKPFRSYNAFGEDQTLFSCHEECYMVR